MDAPGDHIGTNYDPVDYAVRREAIDAYVAAVADDRRIWGLVAPPMFAVVYAGPALGAALLDPALGIDMTRLVHGAQRFEWPGPVVRVGDVISTTATYASRRRTAGLSFHVFTTESVNQRREPVCRGTWTNIVRGDDA